MEAINSHLEKFSVRFDTDLSISRPWLLEEFRRYPDNARLAIVAHVSWINDFIASVVNIDSIHRTECIHICFVE